MHLTTSLLDVVHVCVDWGKLYVCMKWRMQSVTAEVFKYPPYNGQELERTNASYCITLATAPTNQVETK